MHKYNQTSLFLEESLYHLLYSTICNSAPIEYSQYSDNCWCIKINPNLILWNYINGKYSVNFNNKYLKLTNEHQKKLWEIAAKTYSLKFTTNKRQYIKTLYKQIRSTYYSK